MQDLAFIIYNFYFMIETLLQTDYSLMETLNLPAYHTLSWDTFFFNVSNDGRLAVIAESSAIAAILPVQ